MTGADEPRPLAGSDGRGEAPGLSRWGLALLMVAAFTVAWTTLDRFQDPVGEKYVVLMPPGNADFFFPFGGARALLAGENPYLNELPGLDDPWRRGFGMVKGRQYRGLYPPTHFLIYLPLALATPDFRTAGRFLFYVNLVALLLMAVAAWWWIADITRLDGEARKLSLLLVPILASILACNVGTSLGLERGNGGDILAAALCWAAVALLQKRHHLAAMVLLVPAVFIKGYPIWFGVGLTLLHLRRDTWKPLAAGLAIGLAVFVLPVVRYFPESLALLADYRGITGNAWWWNHGFENVFRHAFPALVGPGRWAMTLVCFAVSVVCWLRARRTLGAGDRSMATLWTVLFATFALETVLGFARQSFVYNLVLIMPGLLVAFAVQSVFARSCRLSPAWTTVLGVSGLLSCLLIFKPVLFASRVFPATGIGLVLFIVTMAGALLAGRLAAKA